MTEHEYRDQTSSNEVTDEGPTARAPSGTQPLILYDLATLIGAAYQQRITVTKQGTVAKRFVDMLRPRLHWLPRYDDRQADSYIEMLVEMAQRLGLITIASPFFEGEEKPYLRPAIEAGLEKWSRLHAYGQARAFLVEWKKNRTWRDIYSADIQQWHSSDWDPLAARGLLIELLSADFYQPEHWYLVSPLLDTIWSKSPFFLRPARHQGRKRTDDFPYEFRNAWERYERNVYLGILSSTLSELGIVSLASHPRDYTTGPLSQPTRFKLTDFGAQVVSKSPVSLSGKHSNRLLVVQPTFEVILLQFHTPTLYQLLPFTEITWIEQASRLTLTKNSILKGMEREMGIEQMLAILNASSKKAVPQNVERTMHDWAKAYRGAEPTEILHIKVSSEAVADELCASPAWREYQLEKIAPNRLLAHHVYDPLEFRRRLKETGIVLPD